jgi:DNA-binding LytR/AlgR family response regulator
MPSALLVDADALARAELRRVLAKAWPELQVVAECDDGEAALEALHRLAPDLALLDIHLPGAAALAVARAAGARCHVVFTTDYDSDAIEAFEAGAIDYLLKPIQADRLAPVVLRLQQRLAGTQAAPALDARVDQLVQRLRQRNEPGGAGRLRWINASVGDVIERFSIDDVLFFQGDEKSTRVVTAGAEAQVGTPLEEIAAGLDPDVFWQVQRGVIVRGSAVSRAQRDELGHITLHLERHAETLAVSPAWAWRFVPM